MTSSWRDRDWYRKYDADQASPVIPAATVVVLRDGVDGIETLMLRRSSTLSFIGGMWVFPGGKIDPEDYPEDGDIVEAARRAAVREAAEEAAQTVQIDDLAWFAHWLPPPMAPKRFGTWFFAAPASGEDVTVDDGEITEHIWAHPTEVLARRDAKEIEMAPPTWVTLHDLARYATVAEAMAELGAREPRFYETHIATSPEGPVALWEGDAGYESTDPDLPGPRHRLVLADVYQYDDSGAPYRQ